MEKRFRLRKSGEFRMVRAEGRSWAHPMLVLYARPNQTGTSRAGFSVSKRIGKAVARNRVKRLLREAVRLSLPGLRSGHDLLFIARVPVAKADCAAVRAAVVQLLTRARLWTAGAAPGGEPRVAGDGEGGREDRRDSTDSSL